MINEKKDNVVQLKDLRDSLRTRIEVLEKAMLVVQRALATLNAEVAKITPKEPA